MCIALESLALINRLPPKQRAAVLATAMGENEAEGMSDAMFRKMVQYGRENLRVLADQD